MHLTSYGGAGGVTGSKHLLTIGEMRLLFDCGTFQGLPDTRERNRQLPFLAESISHVVLSHAHLDHCGMLPLLCKQGFSGSIFATAATRDVAAYMLADAASIEEQDARYRIKHNIGTANENIPIFSSSDVPAVIKSFVAVPYARQENKWKNITDNIRLKLYDAGHIIGSAVSVLEIKSKTGLQRIAYTGDIGAPGTPLLYDPEVPAEEINTVIIESTYGSRDHESLTTTSDRLAATINDVYAQRGKIIIPAFSLGRTQVIVYLLHKLTDEGRIPRLPIFVDSPLATNLTSVYRDHRQDYDNETWQDFAPRANNSGHKENSSNEHRPLAFSNLVYTRSQEESKALNSRPGPYIVIAASGMMTAGRVVHHLRHSIANKNNAIFITGYQAQGTLGRRLLEGAKSVEIYKDRFKVRASIHVFNAFSAHSDRTQLIQYLNRFRGIKRVILVHGEPNEADVFKYELERLHPNWRVLRPKEGDKINLD